MRQLLSLSLVLWLCPGCFVLEEIDKGAAIMDQHASQGRREAEAAQKKQAADADEHSLFADLQNGATDLKAWWDEAWAEAPPERDPDDNIVSCEIENRTRFLRKSDCRIRGGRYL